MVETLLCLGAKVDVPGPLYHCFGRSLYRMGENSNLPARFYDITSPLEMYKSPYMYRLDNRVIKAIQKHLDTECKCIFLLHQVHAECFCFP